MAYESSQGGAPHGPSTKPKSVFENGSLAELFFLLFPLSLVNTIAKQMQQYGIEDWVHPEESTQRNITDDNSNDEDKLNDEDKIEHQDKRKGQDESVGQDEEAEMDVDIEDDRLKQARKFTPCKEENSNVRHG
jgi:hypothetical protein